MNFSVLWIGEPLLIDEEVLKNGIDIDRLNNLSCCDAVTIVLEAKGLLNEKIEGLVTCKCKKKLMRFSANVDLKEITLDFMEEMK